MEKNLKKNVCVCVCVYIYIYIYMNYFAVNLKLSQIDGETVETMSDFIFLGSKITTHGDAAMKLKDAYSLEGKL